MRNGKTILQGLLCSILAFSLMWPLSGCGGPSSAAPEPDTLSTIQVLTSSGLADSSWPKFGQNPQNTGRSPYTGPQIPRLQWSLAMGGYVDSSPAIDADGTIYVVPWDGRLYAVNSDGSEKWSYSTDGGGGSSPAIGADGTIYFSSGGTLYAVNPDGNEDWRLDTGAFATSSPAIGVDGTIYSGTYDGQLHALNPDGSEKWTVDIGYVHRSSSPAIGHDGTIYISSLDHSLYAVDQDGNIKWSVATGWMVISSPAVGSDGTIYVGSTDSDDDRLYSINPDGTIKWSFSTDGSVRSSPAIGVDGTVYVGSGRHQGRVYAINPDGSEKWSFTTEGAEVYSSPAIGADGTIYVRDWEKKLYAINPDGSEKWSIANEWSYYSSPAIGADGTIYVGSAQNLHAIEEGVPPDLCTHRVAYIPVTYKDFGDPTHTVQELKQRAAMVADYYEQQSYGKVKIGSQFIFDQWRSLGKTLEDYNRLDSPSDQAQVAFDALHLAGVDTSEYDAIILVEPYGQNQSVAWGEPYNMVLTTDRRTFATWAHELGHAIFKWDEYYGEYSEDFTIGRGDIGYWGLMGNATLMNPTSPIMSYNKVLAGWLTYQTILSDQYGTYPVKLLMDLQADDQVYRYQTEADANTRYYIFEGRHPPDGIQTDPWDNYTWGDYEYRLDEEKGVLLYSIYDRQGMEHVAAIPHVGALTWLDDETNRVTLTPGDTYADDLAGVMLTAHQNGSELAIEISRHTPLSRIVISLWELLWEVSGISLPSEPFPSENRFDIDLHVYTYDGRRVGMNYATGEYLVGVEDARTSGNTPGGGPEWISVPDHENVYFVIDSTPALKWAEEHDIEDLEIGVEVQVLFYDDEGEPTHIEPLALPISLYRSLYCVETATGTGIAGFTTSDGTIENLEAVLQPDSPPAGYEFPHGLFSFKVTDLDYDGQTVTVTVDLPTPVPAGTKWWKYHDGQWHDYGIPITISGNTITITLTDGGVGDIDDIARQITDPGGPGYPLSRGPTVGWEGSSVDKAAVRAPWIALLAAIAGASLMILRRRQTQS